MANNAVPCIQVETGRYVPVVLVADNTKHAVPFVLVGGPGIGVVPIKIVVSDVNGEVPGFLTND